MKGLIYIIPCQSRFGKKSIDTIVNEQVTTVSGPVKGCLADHGWLPREPKDKEAFPSLKDRLYQLQSKQLPYTLANRARRERTLVRSIQLLLRNRPDIVIRRPDKRKGFYLGNTADFERKAIKYMTDTEAYQELPNGLCPLADTYQAVRSLLQELLKRKAINQDQHKMMSPKFETLELAHLHFLPKVHKVGLTRSVTSVCSIPCLIVARYATSTDHSFHPCTSHAYFTVSRQALGTYLLESGSKDDLHQCL